MSAAHEKDLGVIHRLLTEQFTALLSGSLKRPIYDKDGALVGEETIYATAAELSVIRAFLKDNEITASMDKGGALDALREKLAQARSGGKPLAPSSFDMPDSVQ